MISQTAEYALRAVVWLAANEKKAVSTHDVSTATKVPPGYMPKVLQALVRAKLAHSTPGRSGGFRLARTPDQISVLDVINAVDGIQRIKHCPLGIKSHGSNLCPLHRRLDMAMEIVEQTYGKTTMAELLAEQNGSTPLCENKRGLVQLGGVK